MRQRAFGIGQVILAGFCFGFLGIFGKWAYSLGLSTGEFLSLRFLTAAALLGPILACRSESPLRIGKGAVWRSLFLGACGYALFSSCYFMALRGLSVSLTVLLLYTYPLWVTLGAGLLLGETLTRAQRWALPIIFLGLTLLLWGELQVRDPLALLLGLLSAVFYSAYILASRSWLRGVPSLPAAFYVMLGAGLVLGGLQLRAIPVSTEPWLALLGTAVVGTILPISLFLASLQKLSSAEVSMLSLFEPCTGVLLGVWLYGDKLQEMQLAGGVLIAIGLVLVARPKPA